jgi:hypothetical protein
MGFSLLRSWLRQHMTRKEFVRMTAALRANRDPVMANSRLAALEGRAMEIAIAAAPGRHGVCFTWVYGSGQLFFGWEEQNSGN